MHFIHQNNINSMEGIRNEDSNLEQKLVFFFLIITFCPNSKIFGFEKHTKIIPEITI